MSLVNRANERIELSRHSEGELTVDHDSDSSVSSDDWITVSYYYEGQYAEFYEEGYFNLTYEEAEKLRDRLNLILGQ